MSQVLGLGTPASNGGLKAGDVLVQVELQMLMTSHWKANILGLNSVYKHTNSFHAEIFLSRFNFNC